MTHGRDIGRSGVSASASAEESVSGEKIVVHGGSLIDASDLQFETWPPAPTGGQHVSIMRRGVRITHLPSGLVDIHGTPLFRVEDRAPMGFRVGRERA